MTTKVHKVLRLTVVCCHVNKEYPRFSVGVFSRMQCAVFATPEVVKSFCTLLLWSLKFITVPTYAVSRASDVQLKPSPFNAEVMFGRCLSQLRLRGDFPVFFWGWGAEGGDHHHVMFHDKSVAASKASCFLTQCDLMLPVLISCILSFP